MAKESKMLLEAIALVPYPGCRGRAGAGEEEEGWERRQRGGGRGKPCRRRR